MQAVLEGKFDDIELWAEQAQTLGEDLGFSKCGTRTKKMKTCGSVCHCVSNVVRSACNTLSIYLGSAGVKFVDVALRCTA